MCVRAVHGVLCVSSYSFHRLQGQQPLDIFMLHALGSLQAYMCVALCASLSTILSAGSSPCCGDCTSAVPSCWWRCSHCASFQFRLKCAWCHLQCSRCLVLLMLLDNTACYTNYVDKAASMMNTIMYSCCR
jgi:hypothetical protein